MYFTFWMTRSMGEAEVIDDDPVRLGHRPRDGHLTGAHEQQRLDGRIVGEGRDRRGQDRERHGQDRGQKRGAR